VFIKVVLGGTEPSVTLEEPGDCKRFHVTVAGGTDRTELAAALSEHGIGRLVDEDAWISVAEVRRLAAGVVGPGWEADFNGMVTYAAGKGWLSPGGEELQAHVEWPA
jgi:hypothetical protein